MIIVLPNFLQNKILNMPETGMGYKVVTIITTEGKEIPGVIVLNGSIAKLPRRIKLDK